jgi:DNA-binding NtrC family response regulator
MENILNARVLLVDDEKDFLEVLSERLETRGLKVKAVNSGEEAIAKSQDQSFDAIILDLSMPGIDGLETLKRIKEQKPDAEIIILTGHGSIKTGIEAMKLGAEDFLEKPVDITELLKKISEAQDKRILILQEKSQQELKKILHSKNWG